MEAVQGLIGKFSEFIITPAIFLVFTAGFFLFVWGLVQFLWNLDEGSHQEGKDHMLWGIAGMFIMVAVYGIIAMISNTFDLGIGPDGSYEPDLSRLKGIKYPGSF